MSELLNPGLILNQAKLAAAQQQQVLNAADAYGREAMVNLATGLREMARTFRVRGPLGFKYQVKICAEGNCDRLFVVCFFSARRVLTFERTGCVINFSASAGASGGRIASVSEGLRWAAETFVRLPGYVSI